MSSSLTVLFDGECPLCRREISHYQKIAGDSPIQWLDVTLKETDLAPFNLTPEEALRSFHVVNASGVIVTGARAFVTLWSVLPWYRWLASIVRRTGALPLLEWIYVRFARWHFRRRCPDGVCSLREKETSP